MKTHKIRYIAAILFIISPFGAWAQQLVTDSISILELIEAVEKNTSYRVYTTIEEPFKVKRSDTSRLTAESLRQALTGTLYKVTVYGNQVFIFPDAFLSTTLPPVLKGEKPAVDGQQSSSFIPVVQSSSENKVYEMGNKYKPSSEEMVTLTGRVSDFKTGQSLEGINIVHREPWVATVTNREGNFTIELPVGYNAIEISGLNIKETRRQFMMYGDGTVHIELEEESHLLDEVLIVSGRVQNVKSTQLGMEKFQPSLLKNIPTAMGELDVLKMLQTLPGIKTVGEASSGYNVRGSAADQNLLLLNNGTIYNPNHLFGFFTAFNSDMIKDAELYKSSIPSQYGGRIASVLNVTGKEASKEKFTGSAGIGLVTSKLNLEIPIIKEKTSLLLSGRTTYSDWIMNLLPKKSGYRDGDAGFYDLGGVFSHTLNERNKLNVYGYYSHDRFAFNNNQKYAYSNMNFSANWRSVFSEKLTGNFSFGHDHYDYRNDESVEEAVAARLSFAINQWFGKFDFSYRLNDKHTLNFGLMSQLYDINSGTYEPIHENSLVRFDQLQKDKALESAIYIGDEWEITPKLSVNAGIRYSMFNLLGPRTYYTYQDGTLPSSSTLVDSVSVGSGKIAKTYRGPEFRLSARYAFNDDFSVKAGFNTMRQYIHKVSNTMIMSPTDTWKLSDNNIKPQSGWQLAAGAYYNTPDQALEFSVEGYYKKLKDYLDYRSSARLIMNHHLEMDVINTEGYAYGVEFQVKKPSGKLNGWVSYTYSRTFLRQNDPRISRPVNNGEWYPTEYDKPHDFKLVGNYKFTRRYSLSFNVDYSTGRPTTIPAGQYYDEGLNSMQVYYTDRNSYRIPDYFRLDLSFNVEPSHHLTLLTHSSVSFGIYNLLGRKNVYSIYYVSEHNQIQGYRMSIFGAPIPFITYNIKF
ncbi:TonB-dependent receptor [Bacteroides sp. UBA939]|uniref:TonB-dependent receptor n=1 Tax=Bacteroides sp. UBA939 TaxID=1946092 RepID=UPI0025C1EBC9|nr:TonB-dependent receptor [Bacteroides sp. UBA939]